MRSGAEVGVMHGARLVVVPAAVHQVELVLVREEVEQGQDISLLADLELAGLIHRHRLIDRLSFFTF